MSLSGLGDQTDVFHIEKRIHVIFSKYFFDLKYNAFNFAQNEK